MAFSVASATECADFALEALGLDRQQQDLFSASGLAASLRRAASFLCPATPGQLVDAVVDVLSPLRPDGPALREDVQAMVDSLISAGDLIELPRESARPARLLFLGPPSYVEKHAGTYLVMGIRPYGQSLVGTGSAPAVRYDRHRRTVEVDASEAPALFRTLGLQRINRPRWAAEPERLSAEDLVARLGSRLDVARAAGSIPELKVIDPAAKVTYYSGRWRSVEPNDCGDFVARRPQEYGNPLWCAVRVHDGSPIRLIDFPLDDFTVPGRDEAWRLQAAIDESRSAPQVFSVTPASNHAESSTVDFFGPVPTWAQRYLDLVGDATNTSAGSLFSYAVPNAALTDLTEYLGRTLWISKSTNGGTS
jgi:hypothetical protein